MTSVLSCSNDENPTVYVEQAGVPCQSAAQCYPLIDAASLIGTATCMIPPSDGYCTHTCTQDSDCCAVPGECRTGLSQVCTTYTSTTGKYCMLSCEGDAGDPQAYCHLYAHQSFVCAASGGGDPRKVCKP